MRRFATFSLVVAAGLAAGTASADVVWTGAGADGNAVFADDNYNFGASTLTEVNQTTPPGTIDPVNDNVTYTGVTIAANDFAGFGQIAIGDGFTMTLDGSSFTTNASGGFGGNNDGADVASTFDLINGSSASIQFASVGATVNVDGTSSLTIRGGGDGINSQTETTVINLALGAQLTLPTVAEFTEQGGEIFVNGVSFTDDNTILEFNGTTATAVPEPGSLALLGLGGLALIRRRRA